MSWFSCVPKQKNKCFFYNILEKLRLFNDIILTNFSVATNHNSMRSINLDCNLLMCTDYNIANSTLIAHLSVTAIQMPSFSSY